MRRTNGWLLAIALVIAIAVLATFQYRWLGSLSAAEEERAKGLRDIAAHHFQGDVDREIAGEQFCQRTCFRLLVEIGNEFP